MPLFFIFTPMNKIITLLCFCVALGGKVLSQSAKELQETARSFMQQGDYANALLVLNRATQLAPNDIDISKDLALSYYLQKDFNKSLEVINPLLEREDADDQCYQIACNNYKQLVLLKDCDKLLRRGIKKFPASGAMYNELGELLWAQQDYEAIRYWEKGIESDPGYSKNYYNAAKHYHLTGNRIWSLLYGEMFVNMEPFTYRTPEIKALILDGYKRLFADMQMTVPEGYKNKFTTAYINAMNRQNSVATSGINPEVLTMIRSRFILDWYYVAGDNMPFKLFELHRQLLQEGMFDAYNQWLFGAVQNLAAYQNWIMAHTAENDEFVKFQRGRIFKAPMGQYYR